MEALDGVGVVRGGVGMVVGVHLSFCSVRNGQGTLLLVLEAAAFAFVQCPGIVVNTEKVFLPIYLFLV